MIKPVTSEDYNREAINDIDALREYIFEKWKPAMDGLIDYMQNNYDNKYLGDDFHNKTELYDDNNEDELYDVIIGIILSYQLNKRGAGSKQENRSLRGGVRKESEFLNSFDGHIEALRALTENAILKDDILERLAYIKDAIRDGRISPQISVSISTKDDVRELIKDTLDEYNVPTSEKPIEEFIETL